MAMKGINASNRSIIIAMNVLRLQLEPPHFDRIVTVTAPMSGDTYPACALAGADRSCP
jgi:hypothetical protein